MVSSCRLSWSRQPLPPTTTSDLLVTRSLRKPSTPFSSRSVKGATSGWFQIVNLLFAQELIAEAPLAPQPVPGYSLKVLPTCMAGKGAGPSSPALATTPPWAPHMSVLLLYFKYKIDHLKDHFVDVSCSWCRTSTRNIKNHVLNLIVSAQEKWFQWEICMWKLHWILHRWWQRISREKV